MHLEKNRLVKRQLHESSLLEKAISITYQTERTQAASLLKTLSETVLKGTLIWNDNLLRSINTAIQTIDAIISQQLIAFMHHEKFKKLEGTWRGLYYLVSHSETTENLQLKVVNISKQVLAKDLIKAVEFDQSQLFRKIYEDEFGTPGGTPYGVLIGDYEFSNHPDDIDILRKIAAIAAAAFCPFITAASPHLFGFKDWTDLVKTRDLEKIFDTVDYIKWRNLRESEEARFLTLVLPRVLARLPYGKLTKVVEAFAYEETGVQPTDKPQPLAHADYCWMNAAYVLGLCFTNAFTEHGWCTAIRGPEGGGCVTGLPLHTFISHDGDKALMCPTEVAITDRRELELSRLGFLPLSHYKNTDYAVFFGAQTLQKPHRYEHPEANANALISARLPCIMATSRFTHYLKIMSRDKIGSFSEAKEIESWLNQWINTYVNGNVLSGPAMKAKYPLAQAKIKVEAIPGKAGNFQAVIWLRPWLQFEELTASFRLVATIPQQNSE